MKLLPPTNSPVFDELIYVGEVFVTTYRYRGKLNLRFIKRNPLHYSEWYEILQPELSHMPYGTTDVKFYKLSDEEKIKHAIWFEL